MRKQGTELGVVERQRHGSLGTFKKIDGSIVIRYTMPSSKCALHDDINITTLVSLCSAEASYRQAHLGDHMQMWHHKRGLAMKPFQTLGNETGPFIQRKNPPPVKRLLASRLLVEDRATSGFLKVSAAAAEHETERHLSWSHRSATRSL